MIETHRLSRPTCDTVTYDVVGSPRSVDAITYCVVRTLSKVVKTSHILQCYQPYLGRGSTSHDAMQSGVVIWLSEFFKCSTFVDAIKATLAEGRLPLSNYWGNDDLYMHGVTKSLYYYLN
uniref:Uncharacterized protein n=1 Tax=Cucumis melo TaxID=3656 RepID=A0A9I9EIS4_CUCME